MRGMARVQPHAAHMIAVVDHGDPVRLLDHRHLGLLENERRWKRPALVRRVAIGDALQRQLAEMLHHICRPGLQNRILVISDQLVVVADALLARRLPSLNNPLRPARQIRNRPGADHQSFALGAVRLRWFGASASGQNRG